MIALNDTQTWSVIGVVAALLIGAVKSKVDGLDRDVNALMKHTFGIDRE